MTRGHCWPSSADRLRFDLPPAARGVGAARGPRHRPRRGAHARRAPATTVDVVHATFSDLPRLPRRRATSSSSTRRARSPPPSTPPAPTASPRRAPVDAPARRPVGRRGPRTDDQPVRPTPRPGWTPGPPRRRRRRAAGAVRPLARPAVGRGPAPARPAAHATWPSTAGPSATATSTGSWPIATYQNVYATEPGSAEMPSAGRPFTPEVITRLVAKGVGVAPIVLHTGVSSLEAHEPPYPEQFRVSAAHRPRRQRHPPRRAAGSSPSAPPSCGPSRRSSTSAAASTRARAGPRRSSPRARRAGRRRPAHRLARARGVPPRHARGGRRPTRSSSGPTRPPWPTATSGTSSATSTSSCRDDRDRARRSPRSRPPGGPWSSCSRRGRGVGRRAGRRARRSPRRRCAQQLKELEDAGFVAHRRRGDEGRGRPDALLLAHAGGRRAVPAALRRPHQRAARLRRPPTMVPDALRTPPPAPHRGAPARLAGKAVRRPRVVELARILEEDGYLATAEQRRQRTRGASSSATAPSSTSPSSTATPARASSPSCATSCPTPTSSASPTSSPAPRPAPTRSAAPSRVASLWRLEVGALLVYRVLALRSDAGGHPSIRRAASRPAASSNSSSRPGSSSSCRVFLSTLGVALARDVAHTTPFVAAALVPRADEWD